MKKITSIKVGILVKWAVITFVAVLSVFLPHGCREKSVVPDNLKDGNIDFSFLDTLSYQLVPLETTEESRIGNINHLLFDGDIIFVFDNTLTFSVYIFTSSGKYLSKIFRVGDGEGEYGSTKLAFDLDRERKEILIYDVAARKIVRYSYMGEFIRENRLADFRGTEFAYLGDDRYAFWMNNDDEHQVLITDSTGVVISRHNPIPSKYALLLSLIPGFFSTGADNNVYYIPIWEDKLYQISGNGIKLKMDLKFSNNIVSADNEIELLGRNQLQEKYSCFYSLHVNEKGQFVTSIRYLSEFYEETLGVPLHIFGDLNSGRLEGGKLTTSVKDFRKYGLGIGYPVGQTGEYFVRVIDTGLLKSIDPDTYANIQSTDNPHLFFYKINI